MSLLDPDFIKNFIQPPSIDAEIGGLGVRYAGQGDGLVVLYFHGSGTGFHTIFPRERAIVEAGYRLLIPNRPGYPGTTLAHGKTPTDCADMAAALLDKLQIRQVAVIGLSGGGPAALSFAARHRDRTTGMILQSAQIQPWNRREFIPRFAQENFHHWPLIGKLWFIFRFSARAKKVLGDKALFAHSVLGGRFDAVQSDPATGPLIEFLFEATTRDRQSKGTRNDFRMFLFDRYAPLERISCPTLIIHDPLDTLVPIAHAHYGQAHIPNAELCEFATGGHLVWLGADARRMHAQRVTFLNRIFAQA